MKPEKQLYQWDVNQYLTGINPAAQYVDYTIGNDVIRLETDGTRCRIPDEVLQTYGGKTCYERYPDGTFRAYSFTVLYAPKPPDYVFTPEERTTFEALTARVDAAIDEIKRRADSGEFTPVKGVDYFTDAEKDEMMESVSDGAIGEFREVVNSATAEYDANAETKTAEFDSNAAALQTEVDRLRGECDQLAEENRKQENRIDALIKLNKGQTYDILAEEGEAASRTAPSGSKYVSVDKVGGHSEVIDGEIVSSQIDALEVRGKNLCQICTSPSKVENGVNWHNNGDGTITATGVANDYTVFEILQPMTPIPNLIKDKIITISAGLAQTSNVVLSGFTLYDKSNKVVASTLSGKFGGTVDMSLHPNAEYMTLGVKRNSNIKVDALITPMIEIGPTATPYKSYSLQTIPTNLPVLNSAGSAYDYIELNEGKLYTWTYIEGNEVKALTEPVITDIDIPTELTDWLEVEAGGSLTFHNADESKQLPVPNAVSWVRKLNEVN